MTPSQSLAAALALLFASSTVAQGQSPLAPARPTESARPRAAGAASSPAPPTSQYRRRSIVHHYPHPYPEYYHGDQTAGFRNPGGVGRYAEYYSGAGTSGAEAAAVPEQGRPDPVRVARFDQGGGAPDRSEQLSARQIGIQRSNQIMNHIDRYARPNFGVGFFGGFY